MKKQISVGIVGLGKRGICLADLCLSEMPDVRIDWLCDVSEEALAATRDMLEKKGYPYTPKMTKDYRDVVADKHVDAVLALGGWDMHMSVARASLLAGKYTAIEVGCAYDISECWALVDASEATGAPLMMLENDCYDRRVLTALHMAKLGLFGEIVHCDGAYRHYLAEYDLFRDASTEHLPYRLWEYVYRNAHQYPTHDLGPAAKILNINRGNRFMTLVSVASKARGLADYAARTFGEESEFAKIPYRQGDIVTTVLTCAGGETVTLNLDTSLPRPNHLQDFCVRGTRGMCSENLKNFYLLGMDDWHTFNEDEFFKQYDHPIHREVQEKGVRGYHGGIDWITLRAFIESVKNGTNTPIDVYDTATLLSIGALSEASIAKGGAPVEVPDFTRGKWFRREPAVRQKYSLDLIVDDPDTPVYPE